MQPSSFRVCLNLKGLQSHSPFRNEGASFRRMRQIVGNSDPDNEPAQADIQGKITIAVSAVRVVSDRSDLLPKRAQRRDFNQAQSKTAGKTAKPLERGIGF
jgi:hypothetical protein